MGAAALSGRTPAAPEETLPEPPDEATPPEPLTPGR